MTKNKINIKNQSRWFVFLLTILVTISCSSQEQTKYKAEWPSINKETKPWTRWWWQGSAVDKENLTANMEALKDAGFGGIEVTPIYGVKGYEKEFKDFLSPEWMEVFTYTLTEGQRLDLGIDLAGASGWPFGGPWVSAKDACKDVKYKVYTLQDGEKLNEKIEFIQEPLVRAVGHRVGIDEVKFPISSNNNLQELALDQVRFKKKLPLQTLIAYNGSGENQDITDKVDSNGELNWVALEGTWNLYAIFEGWHGKMVERASPGGEGNVIDHFSESAIQDYLNVFAKGSENFDVSNLRAFFNDSYEVDDASGEADWTPLMFSEFKKLRGYDLKDYLPALFGKDSEEMNNRVLCDFRETISDLLLNKFTKQWTEWSHKHNAITRNQAHGSPANILDLYAASDIPEAEGKSALRMKMTSSAGHVSGKPLVSCEAATWLNEHFLSNLSDVKKNLDRYLANGINHIVYHGTPYSPISEDWPGWMFYAAVHFAPTNTWWDDLKTINSYVAGCQSFMQNSTPANDVLLYFPIYDTWSEKGRSMLPHFGHANEELTKDLSEMLLANGYTFDYISDKQIQQLNVEDSKIRSNQVNYKTIIIPECNYIPLETIQKIIALAKEGTTVVLQNNFPNDVPGLNQLKERQKGYEELKATINFEAKDNLEVSKVGNGEILKGNDIESILNEAGVKPESMAKEGLWFNKVLRDEGMCYFISNWGDEDIDQWIKLQSSGKDAVWFNPMNKELGKATTRNINENDSEVYVQLGKGETLILQWYPSQQNVNDYPLYETTDNTLSLNGDWTVEFVKGGPTLPDTYVTNELQSWTKHSEELKWFSGTAGYKTTFEKPDFKAETYQLDLGKVYESADVYLNGDKLATLVGPEFKLTIKANQLKNENTLEVQVTNLMANRIIDMDKRGVNYKKFYNINFAAHDRENVGKDGLFTAKNWEPLESGLIGPVKLIGLTSKK